MSEFQPSLTLSKDSVLAAKRALRDCCQGIGSVHLTEALACGLGFRTQAALKAALETGQTGRQPFDTARFLRRLEELGYDAPPAAAVVGALVESALMAALSDVAADMTLPFAPSPAVTSGMHLLCSGDDASPVRFVDKAARMEVDAMLVDPRRVLRVLRVGSERIRMMEVVAAPGGPEIRQVLLDTGSEFVKSVEAALSYRPHLAVFEDASSRIKANLAFLVARRGVRTLAGIRARTAFAAVSRLDALAVPRKTLADGGIIRRIDVLRGFSGGSSPVPMLRETHADAAAFLIRAVQRLPSRRLHADPYARPEGTAPDPIRADGAFRIELVGMIVEAANLLNGPHSRPLLYRCGNSRTGKLLDAFLLPRHDSHAGKLLEMAGRLQDGDDYKGTYWALELCRRARLTLGAVAEGTVKPAGTHACGMHRNLVVGLLGELPTDTTVFRKADCGLVTALEMVKAAWRGEQTAVDYAAALGGELQRLLFDRSIFKVEPSEIDRGEERAAA